MRAIEITGDQEFEALTRALASEYKKHHNNNIGAINLLKRVSRNRLINDVASLRQEVADLKADVADLNVGLQQLRAALERSKRWLEVSRLASATQGLAAAISRHDEADVMTRQDSISAAEQPPNKLPPRIELIQHIVARHYGVSRNDILSQRRTAAVVLPRHIAMYLARTEAALPLPQIGRYFGNRDHTTVLHAVRRIEALIETAPMLAVAIEAIRKELAEGQHQ